MWTECWAGRQKNWKTTVQVPLSAKISHPNSQVQVDSIKLSRRIPELILVLKFDPSPVEANLNQDNEFSRIFCTYKRPIVREFKFRQDDF